MKFIVVTAITVDIVVVVIHLKKSKVGNNNPALTTLCSIESSPENHF